MNAVTIVRRLLATGWQSNSHTEMSDGSVVVDGTRGDNTITACVTDDGTASLTLTGLSASQVAAALVAVGHMPPATITPRRPRSSLVGWSPATRAAARMLRQLDTADLGDVASGRVPLPPTGTNPADDHTLTRIDAALAQITPETTLCPGVPHRYHSHSSMPCHRDVAAITGNSPGYELPSGGGQQ